MAGVVKRFFGRFLAPIRPDPPSGITNRQLYDFAYQNGYAWGEVMGRKEAFDDLIEHLRLMGRTLEDVQPADVQAVRAKSMH